MGLPDWISADESNFYTFNGNGFISRIGKTPIDDDYVCEAPISSSDLPQLVELWRLQDCLLGRLKVSECEVRLIKSKKEGPQPARVAHYCRTSAVGSILENGLKLCAISAANDPTEGKCFANFLKCDKEGEESMLALQCSFSKRIDDLNQFRLYGRDVDTKREGTGTCLVFGMDLFVNDRASDASVICSTPTKNKLVGNQENKLPLYWVLYYDPVSDVFYHTPAQRENVLGNVKHWHSVQSTKAEKDAVFDLLKKIQTVFRSLAKKENSRRLAWRLMIYLRHLIKDASYRDEQDAYSKTLSVWE